MHARHASWQAVLSYPQVHCQAFVRVENGLLQLLWNIQYLHGLSTNVSTFATVETVHGTLSEEEEEEEQYHC